MASSGGFGVFGHGNAMFGAAAAAAPSQPTLVVPSAMDSGPNRHGSAEQDTRGRVNYLNSMGGTTPRSTSPRTPRNPRARSQPIPDDDYEDRRRDRAERRDDQQNAPPIGVGFRLNACETSLRDHQSEIAAQRIMLDQLTTEMQRQIADRDLHRDRLDTVFALVDQRFTEAQNSIEKIRAAAHSKFETLTTTINGVSQGLAARVEQISMEINVLRRDFLNATPPTNLPTAPAPQPAPQAAPPPPPGMTGAPREIPSSWNVPPAAGPNHQQPLCT